MKKQYFIFTGLFFAAMIMVSSPLMAIGLGAYTTGSAASYSCTLYDDYDSTFDLDVSQFGAGFVLDTAVAKDRVFNYRLNVELTGLSAETESGSAYDGFAFNVFNTFGFGIVRTEKVRFWLGPQIGFGYFYADKPTDYGYYETYTSSIEGATVSVGPMAGININIGPVVSLCFDAGLRASFIFGGIDTYDDYYDFDGSGAEFVVHAGIIFRIHDKYTE